jgi:tRNA pseudouridine38-40 synthase
MMARYKLILAYDGTEFSGFQRQARKIQDRTVQGEIERALQAIGWSGKTILAAGRTDAGVHAAGQVVAFDFEWRHSDLDLLAALNANLPFDIAVQQLLPVRPDFHPRYDAIWRRYRYRIFCQPMRNPLRERYAWRVWPAVDVCLQNEAASHLIGEYDFGAFGSAPRPGGSTFRIVTSANWMSELDTCTFEIVGNAFLYRMVRRIVSLLVNIGQGKVELQKVDFYLQSGTDKYVKDVAPAHGLTLVEAGYANQL